jgi:glucose-6-phosphate-specific signal transduction histidine kinase
MLERQVNNLWNIDTKAWRAARLIGIIIGVFLTAISVLSGKTMTQFDVGISAASTLVLAGGVLTLLLALFFAMVGILNVRTGYGPSTSLSRALTQGEHDADTYPGVLSQGLANSVEMNNRVMKNKADYLRYTFATLYVGIVLLITGVTIALTDLSTAFTGVLLVSCVGVCLFTLDYIVNQRYDETGREDSSEIDGSE